MPAGAVHLAPHRYVVVEDRTGRSGIMRYWVRASAAIDIYLLDDDGLNDFVDKTKDQFRTRVNKKKRRHAEGEVQADPRMDFYLLLVNPEDEGSEVEYATGVQAIERLEQDA